MARDYGTRRSTQQRNNGPHQLLVVVVTFLLGYLTATVFDIQTIGQWMNNQVLDAQSPKPQPTAKQPMAQVPPKPKFEFYTLLSDEKKGAVQPAVKPNIQAAAVTSTPASVTQPVAQITNQTHAHVPANTVNPTTQDPSAVRIAEGKPLAPAQKNHGNFLVQVAAFKARKDAEQMKGTLTLRGYDVNIVQVSNTKGMWFRVVIGPYANRQSAQQAQTSIAKNERLKGMITPANG